VIERSLFTDTSAAHAPPESIVTDEALEVGSAHPNVRLPAGDTSFAGRQDRGALAPIFVEARGHRENNLAVAVLTKQRTEGQSGQDLIDLFDFFTCRVGGGSELGSRPPELLVGGARPDGLARHGRIRKPGSPHGETVDYAADRVQGET
jgi:hypothetical protein